MTLEDRDRDMLIRVEQKLENANQNQNQLLDDLRDVFKRLEHDSKMVTVLSGDLKGHLESSKVRWTNLEKKISEIDQRLHNIETKIEENAENLSKEVKERESFEREIKASIKTIGWIFGILASIATVLSTVSIYAKFFVK